MQLALLQAITSTKDHLSLFASPHSKQLIHCRLHLSGVLSPKSNEFQSIILLCFLNYMTHYKAQEQALQVDRVPWSRGCNITCGVKQKKNTLYHYIHGHRTVRVIINNHQSLVIQTFLSKSCFIPSVCPQVVVTYACCYLNIIIRLVGKSLISL